MKNSLHYLSFSPHPPVWLVQRQLWHKDLSNIRGLPGKANTQVLQIRKWKWFPQDSQAAQDRLGCADSQVSSPSTGFAKVRFYWYQMISLMIWVFGKTLIRSQIIITLFQQLWRSICIDGSSVGIDQYVQNIELGPWGSQDGSSGSNKTKKNFNGIEKFIFGPNVVSHHLTKQFILQVTSI